MQVLIHQHGGSGNHGCEALIRSTYALVKQALPDAQITLYSYRLSDDQKYLADLSDLKVTGLISLPGRFSYANFRYHGRKALGLAASKLPIEGEFAALVKQADLIIAIGGDNYCYNLGYGYWPIDQYIKSTGKPYILWGASLEPADLAKGLANHLRLFDLITVRESISYQAMLKQGMSNISPVADSAFLLKPSPISLPANFKPSQAIGLNFSPLVIKSEPAPGLTMANFKQLALYILENSDCQVALIPHVVWQNNDDRLVLAELAAALPQYRERIFVFEDASAEQLKFIIGQLQFFVGARTHATIAAYSSAIPTLTLGYSVKARGIAKDIFGQEAGYVLPVQDLKEEQSLLNAFMPLWQKRQQIADFLEQKIPEYSKQAELAISALWEVSQIKRPNAYAAMAHDIQQGSSSGGIFAALALAIIEQGGLVLGAAFDDQMQLSYQTAATLEQLRPLIGSKYLRAKMGDCLSQIEQALAANRKVLFCGTPCQAAVVSKKFDNLEQRANLIIAQIVCHGAPPQKVFDLYKAELEAKANAKLSGFNFRDKVSGWENCSLTAHFDDGQKISLLKGQDPYFRLYLANLILSEDCYTCRFKHKTAADLSLGDFWGIKNYLPDLDYSKGVSLVYSHSLQGQAMLDGLKDQIDLQAIGGGGIEKYNPCIYRPSPRPKSRELAMAALESGSFEQVCADFIPKPTAKAKLKMVVKKILGRG